MKTTFKNGKTVFEISENLSITLGDEADLSYRSHINGMQTTEPNNWMACKATGSDGKSYTAWYYVEDTNMDLDNIDCDDPDDIEDEYGNIIYDKDAE